MKIGMRHHAASGRGWQERLAFKGTLALATVLALGATACAQRGEQGAQKVAPTATAATLPATTQACKPEAQWDIPSLATAEGVAALMSHGITVDQVGRGLEGYATCEPGATYDEVANVRRDPSRLYASVRGVGSFCLITEVEQRPGNPSAADGPARYWVVCAHTG